MKKIKILHVYRTFFPDSQGGLEEAIRQICLSTNNDKFETTVFSLSENPYPKFLKIQNISIYREKSYLAPFSCNIGGINCIKTFRTLIESHDIINYHFPWPFADFLHLLIRPKVPCVITYHSDVIKSHIIQSLYKPIMIKMLKSMKRIIATSQNYIKSSETLSHKELSKITEVIPLGINENLYNIIPSYNKYYYEFDIEKPFFLFIGNLRKYKGLDILLQAAKLISAPVVIVGSGKLENYLHKIKIKLDITNVFFLGHVNDEQKIQLLKKCLALVLPSNLRSEAFGMVLVEALMYSKPIISCELGTGTSFVNKKNKTGLIIEPNNPYAMAKAMETLLYNRSLALSMGIESRLRFKKYFTDGCLGRSYRKLYIDLINKFKN